ncbi:polysaccharide pyruvyl transferase family protein [uncultured Ruminococcus sp.]|uniref:polysaccharide pyruvyl transferase family protein n=1 Tax=uncultured Ruminococcus sp. TaxID=165186 RepID=UPI0025F2FF2B|nr:polysaccharide pyruvyl transferase family protein [uncultured Ruminococcus sp.]
MRNILLLDTSVGSLNQGDDIINISIKKNWKELFERNYVMRLATHTPMYTTFQSFLYKDKLSVFKNADYKFLCGTNALYTNMLRPLPTWNINIINCGLVGGTICLGAGIGINSQKANIYTRILYDKVLNHDFTHSVRDNKTKEFLEKLGFKAENTGCPTLWGLTPEHCQSIPKRKGNTVVFTLTYYEKDQKNDKLMIDILCRNYDQVLFWPQCIKDLEYLSTIYDLKKIRVISPTIEGYDMVLSGEGVDYVGNRLHGGIFALQHKCRSIIISIDYRAERMSADYSFECIKREDISSELDKKINANWSTVITGIDFSKIESWKGQFKI